MVYNKAKEEYKWKLWKEREEKKMRELGVSEEIITELHEYDWNCFKEERNYQNHQMPDTETQIRDPTVRKCPSSDIWFQ